VLTFTAKKRKAPEDGALDRGKGKGKGKRRAVEDDGKGKEPARGDNGFGFEMPYPFWKILRGAVEMFIVPASDYSDDDEKPIDDGFDAQMLSKESMRIATRW
jgi:hypothetical protein